MSVDPRLNSGLEFHKAGNRPEAERQYRQVLANQPWNADALLLLGLLQHETGRNAEAVDSLGRAIKAQPNRPDLYRTIVGPLVAMGRIGDAVGAARELARLTPTSFEAVGGLAQLLTTAGDYPNAIAAANRATQLAPREPVVYLILARALGAADRPLEALGVTDRIIQMAPNNVDAWADRGGLLQTLGRIEEAIGSFQRAIQLDPNNLASHNNMGGCYMSMSRPSEAIACFEKAAAIWPAGAKPRNNIGAALKEMGRIDESLPHFFKAVQLDPKYGEAFSNIGASYGAIGEHQKAIAAYRDSVRVTPNFPPAYDNLLMSVISIPEVDEGAVFKEHLEFGRLYADPITAQARPPVRDWNLDRPLRIGYLSPDFREHSVRYFIEPVLRTHNRSQYQIICYLAGRRRDPVTDHLRTFTDGWHAVAGLTDPQLADMVRAHQIDVFVDLAGHTSDNRLIAFAPRPAPVQVTYLGYPTTTGMKAFDYRITDSICDPDGADQFYTEKLVRMPNAFFVYGDDPGKPFDPTLPADRNGVFTFGSFNGYTKVSPEQLRTWAKILSAVPNSKLIMKAKPLGNPSTREAVVNAFSAAGVDPGRIEMTTWVELADHVKMLANVDLMLDTYPYAGHTTSCQSLWMGSAVLTRSGQAFRGRVGETILRHIGLEHFVVRSEQEYVDRAVHLATDWNELRSLRPSLRERMVNSPICNAVEFTRNLEAAYREMWKRACAAHRAA